MSYNPEWLHPDPFCVCGGGGRGARGRAGGAIKPSGMEEPSLGRWCQHQTPAEGAFILGPRGRALGWVSEEEKKKLKAI